MIGLALVAVVAVVWTVAALAAATARPPSIESFDAKAELGSALLATVSIRDLERAASTMTGVRVVSVNDAALLLSVSPRLSAIHRGTGEWVRILRGDERWRFQIRAKSPVNLTIYSQALVEFERDLRMILRKFGVVTFDLYEDAAAPSRLSRPSDPEPQSIAQRTDCSDNLTNQAAPPQAVVQQQWWTD